MMKTPVLFAEKREIDSMSQRTVRKNTISYCKKHNILPTIDTPVTTKRILTKESCESFFVKPEYIDSRRDDEGKFAGWVPGCGGDVWWIIHGDDKVAAYMFNEVYDKE